MSNEKKEASAPLPMTPIALRPGAPPRRVHKGAALARRRGHRSTRRRDRPRPDVFRGAQLCRDAAAIDQLGVEIVDDACLRRRFERACLQAIGLSSLDLLKRGPCREDRREAAQRLLEAERAIEAI